MFEIGPASASNEPPPIWPVPQLSKRREICVTDGRTPVAMELAECYGSGDLPTDGSSQERIRITQTPTVMAESATLKTG